MYYKIVGKDDEKIFARHTGKRYNCLTVKEYIGYILELKPMGKQLVTKKTNIMLCTCNCGKEIEVSLPDLKSGKVVYCGDCDSLEKLKGRKKMIISHDAEGAVQTVKTAVENVEKTMQTNGNEADVQIVRTDYAGYSKKITGHNNSVNDIVGKRFGHLKVLEYMYALCFETDKLEYVLLYKCECDCGNICVASRKELMSGANMVCDKCRGIGLKPVAVEEETKKIDDAVQSKTGEESAIDEKKHIKKDDKTTVESEYSKYMKGKVLQYDKLVGQKILNARIMGYTLDPECGRKSITLTAVCDCGAEFKIKSGTIYKAVRGGIDKFKHSRCELNKKVKANTKTDIEITDSDKIDELESAIMGDSDMQSSKFVDEVIKSLDDCVASDNKYNMIVGRKIGNLEVVNTFTGKGGEQIVRLRCECGEEFDVWGRSIFRMYNNMKNSNWCNVEYIGHAGCKLMATKGKYYFLRSNSDIVAKEQTQGQTSEKVTPVTKNTTYTTVDKWNTTYTTVDKSYKKEVDTMNKNIDGIIVIENGELNVDKTFVSCLSIIMNDSGLTMTDFSISEPNSANKGKVIVSNDKISVFCKRYADIIKSYSDCVELRNKMLMVLIDGYVK